MIQLTGSNISLFGTNVLKRTWGQSIEGSLKKKGVSLTNTS